MTPTPTIEAQKIAEWYAVLMKLIESLEAEFNDRLEDERVALGMLTFLADRGRLRR